MAAKSNHTPSRKFHATKSGKHHSASGITESRRITRAQRQAIGKLNAPAAVGKPPNGGLGPAMRVPPRPGVLNDFDWAAVEAGNRTGARTAKPARATTKPAADRKPSSKSSAPKTRKSKPAPARQGATAISRVVTPANGKGKAKAGRGSVVDPGGWIVFHPRYGLMADIKHGDCVKDDLAYWDGHAQFKNIGGHAHQCLINPVFCGPRKATVTFKNLPPAVVAGLRALDAEMGKGETRWRELFAVLICAALDQLIRNNVEWLARAASRIAEAKVA